MGDDCATRLGMTGMHRWAGFAKDKGQCRERSHLWLQRLACPVPSARRGTRSRVNEPSSQSWQKLSSNLGVVIASLGSRFPAASKGQWLSRKVALWNSPQCAELSDHTKVAWSTQKPTVFGATAKRSIVVPPWVVRGLADCALQPNRSNVSTKVGAGSVAPHPDDFLLCLLPFRKLFSSLLLLVFRVRPSLRMPVFSGSVLCLSKMF